MQTNSIMPEWLAQTRSTVALRKKKDQRRNEKEMKCAKVGQRETQQ